MNRKDRRAAGKRAGEGQRGGSSAADAAPLFANAVRNHQAGHLLEAESLYRQALAADRNHWART